MLPSQQALQQDFGGYKRCMEKGEGVGWGEGVTTNTSHKSGSSLEANTLWADHVLDRPAAR